MRIYDRTKKEDPTCCIVEVFEPRCWSHQCMKPRGKGPDGLYCGTHANQLKRGGTVYTPKDKVPTGLMAVEAAKMKEG